jgi:multidrug efflux system membrane fusion protein
MLPAYPKRSEKMFVHFPCLRPRCAAGAVLAAALATLGWSGGATAQGSPPQGSPPQGGIPSGVPVQATTAKRQDVPVLLRNIGTVQAWNSVQVRARVDGTLDTVFFKEGQTVRRGDPLALIDPRPYAAALALAQAKKAADEAQLVNAQRDLARYASLSRNDFASRQQVDTQAATVAQFEANIKGDVAAIATAQLNLDFCHINAPLEGRVGLRQVDPGNQIHATDTQPIVSITQIHPIAVIFTLPQDDLPQIQAGMARGSVPVLAATSDDKAVLSQGSLETIDNTIDTTTGTIRLKAVFDNADDKLWPGQFVNVGLQVDTLHDVVTVPSPAVQRGPDGLYAYVVKPDSTVAMQPVEVRQDDGQTAVIAKGLDGGVEVVTNGASRLQNGTAVTVRLAKASS